MEQQRPPTRLGALTGKWDLPASDALKTLLEPEPDVERAFYESGLGKPSAATPEAPEEETAPGAEFEVYRDAEGAFQWRLRTQSGRVLAASGVAYPDYAACREAIALVRTLGPGARVKEQS